MTVKRKAAHHADPRFVRWGRTIRQLAAANPDAVCWRDGLTMAQHRARWPSARLTWIAGHTIDGSTTWRAWTDITHVPPLPGDWLTPEVSKCSNRSGAAIVNQRRASGYDW